MPAVVDPDDQTKPTDADAILYPASSGAGEFRALKNKVNALFKAISVNADGEFLLTTNNTGIYSKVTANPSNNAAILYGFASNVVRTGKDNHTVGGQFSAYAGPGIVLAAGQIFGVVSQAISDPTTPAVLVGAEFAVCNLYHNTGTQALWGCNIVFKDRGDGAATPVGGLGANRYNVNSKAIVLSAQPRGTAGEFCGWNTGIFFDATAMDSSALGLGHAIDTASIPYLGGADPATAYKCSSILRMRAMQSIIFDDSSTAVRIYFDPFASRIKITNGGVERWGVDVGTGQVYKNGVLQY